MRIILRVVDSIGDWTGKTTRWLCLILVAVVTYDVIMRYAFNAAPIWGYETSTMLGAALFATAWSYTWYKRSHIRVDVIYAHLPPRMKAGIDVIGSLMLFSPLIISLIIVSTIWAAQAWAINEKMIESSWYPPAAPIRTVVVIGCCLLAMQIWAQLYRDIYFLIRNKRYD